MKYALGIDIGGTKTNIGMVNKDGELSHFKTFATNAENPINNKINLFST